MIVIPMVGLSSRFFKAGYKTPKFRLPIGGSTVFQKSVETFSKYFESDDFLFLCRNDRETIEFIENTIQALKIKQYQIFSFEAITAGQAETVYEGTRGVDSGEELFIFNIDTFRLNFEKPTWINQCDGYLEVFKGEGNHWSFIRPGCKNHVIETTEKNRVSDLCSDGLYYFKCKSDFDNAFLDAKMNQKTVKGEYYIAPLYNHLIKAGKLIFYDLVAEGNLVFCGTPQEYEHVIRT